MSNSSSLSDVDEDLDGIYGIAEAEMKTEIEVLDEPLYLDRLMASVFKPESEKPKKRKKRKKAKVLQLDRSHSFLSVLISPSNHSQIKATCQCTHSRRDRSSSSRRMMVGSEVGRAITCPCAIARDSRVGRVQI